MIQHRDKKNVLYIIFFLNRVNTFDVTGQSVTDMQSKFKNGDVCFTWKFSTSSSSPYVDIMYHKNEWIRVTETTYSVRDVLLYDSIYIHAKDSTGKNVDQWEYKSKLIRIFFYN